MIAFRVTYYSKLTLEFVCEEETAVHAVRTRITKYGKPRKLEFLRAEPSAREVAAARTDGRYIPAYL